MPADRLKTFCMAAASRCLLSLAAGKGSDGAPISLAAKNCAAAPVAGCAMAARKAVAMQVGLQIGANERMNRNKMTGSGLGKQVTALHNTASVACM